MNMNTAAASVAKVVIRDYPHLLSGLPKPIRAKFMRVLVLSYLQGAGDAVRELGQAHK